MRILIYFSKCGGCLLTVPRHRSRGGQTILSGMAGSTLTICLVIYISFIVKFSENKLSLVVGLGSYLGNPKNVEWNARFIYNARRNDPSCILTVAWHFFFSYVYRTRMAKVRRRLQRGLPETGLHSTDARFVSYQDTILDDRGLHYYSDCYVEGATDFILSPGKAFFEVINSLICCT